MFRNDITQELHAILDKTHHEISVIALINPTPVMKGPFFKFVFFKLCMPFSLINRILQQSHFLLEILILGFAYLDRAIRLSTKTAKHSDISFKLVKITNNRMSTLEKSSFVTHYHID